MQPATGIAVRLESAAWQGAAGSGSAAQQVSHQDQADPFQNPFGDKLVQEISTSFPLADEAGAETPRKGASKSGKVSPAGDSPAASPKLPAIDDILPPLEPAPAPAELPAMPAEPVDEPRDEPTAPPTELLPPTLPPSPAPVVPSRQPAAGPGTLPDLTPPAGELPKPFPGTQPSLPLQTPAPAVGPAATGEETAAAPCQRIYNERDCCQEDAKCAAARLALQQNSIKNISLDITAAFKPDAKSVDEERELRESQLRQMPARVWRGRDGQPLAEGRMVDVHNRRIVIQQSQGDTKTVPLGELNDDDLCFLAAWWGVPTECTLGDATYTPRNWEATSFAWKASALCHKPLYFEERQLERYGHTPGPFLEPIASGAHFFLNVAVLPYKMGINPPNECQYALGYYRPGSCAPWLLPPVPLSVRGALLEAGVITGLVFLVP